MQLFPRLGRVEDTDCQQAITLPLNSPAPAVEEEEESILGSLPQERHLGVSLPFILTSHRRRKSSFRSIPSLSPPAHDSSHPSAVCPPLGEEAPSLTLYPRGGGGEALHTPHSTPLHSLVISPPPSSSPSFASARGESGITPDFC